MDTEIGGCMQGAAFVLSGGGAKGAYEAGVWKAMRELHIDKSIRLVSGTSAGALNAALFAQGNLDEALEIWSTISNQHILTTNTLCTTKHHALNRNEKKQLIAFLQQENPLPFMNTLKPIQLALYKWVLAKFIKQVEESLSFHLAKALVPCFLNILYEFKSTQDLQAAFKKTIQVMNHILKDGLFSQEGLQQILDEHYHPQLLLTSAVAMYATAYNVSKRELHHFHFTWENRHQQKDILLASSAIPFVFDQVIIDNDVYIDGGIPFIGDNTPIDVAYQAGYRKLYVVVLNKDELNLKKYKNSEFYIIQPKESLGSALSSLDFDDDYTTKLIQQGYEDALRCLKIKRIV